MPQFDNSPEPASIEFDTPQASKDTKREMIGKQKRSGGEPHGTVVIDDFENVELKKLEYEQGFYYRYKGPKSAHIESLIEDLDQYMKKGLPCWEKLKLWNKKLDDCFDQRNCCNEHQGPITVSKDTIFLLITCIAVTIFCTVKLKVIVFYC